MLRALNPSIGSQTTFSQGLMMLGHVSHGKLLVITHAGRPALAPLQSQGLKLLLYLEDLLLAVL